MGTRLMNLAVVFISVFIFVRATLRFVDIGRFEALYLEDPSKFTADQVQEHFEYACGWGYRRLVSKMLADPRVDPTGNDSKSFHYAFSNSQPKILEILIRDGRASVDLLFDTDVEFSWVEQTRIKWLVNGISKALFDACRTNDTTQVQSSEISKLFARQLDMLVERARSSPKTLRLLRKNQLSRSKFVRDVQRAPIDSLLKILDRNPDWDTAEIDELILPYLATKALVKNALPEETIMHIANFATLEAGGYNYQVENVSGTQARLAWRYSLRPHMGVAFMLFIGRTFYHYLDTLPALSFPVWILGFLFYLYSAHLPSLLRSKIVTGLLWLDAAAVALASLDIVIPCNSINEPVVFVLFYIVAWVFAFWLRIFEISAQ